MSADYEWLNLIEVSGPFLAVPVLREVFPQGLDEFGGARRLRSAYDEWRDAVDGEDADLDALHEAWINEVLRTALDADETLLRRGARIPASTVASLPEHDATLRADVALVDPTHGDAALFLVHIFLPDVDLSASRRFGGLAATPADRMALHLRAVGLPLGLVTNGEQWMVVHAPQGRAGTTASWYARIWRQEPHTLRAFSALLSVRRFFGPPADRLPDLFDRSLKHQDEVTDALGLQVRRAIEVLVQALDRADLDRNRDLLRGVEPRTLYEAGLTVMMRLVFLLAAEERGLLLLGDPRYDAFYAISTLRRQLLEDSDEILERRRSAWSRLLAVFRAVFGGIDHPTLRLPAMGGSLFDPDRFPFLEGRPAGTSWRQHRAEPLPIDDRTVLLLLNAIQTFDGRTLSYKGLDVEQVGHVYEGLLERTVARVEDVTLELEGSRHAKEPQVTLGELESASLDGREAVAALLAERSKRSTSAVRNALAAEVVSEQAARLLAVCRGDVALRDRVKPFARLLRTDPWGYPLVYPKGAFVVALGPDRRETGTHYTPKSLTERIVEETLTPLVYDGPAEGKPRTSWTLRSPTGLLDLKVCDTAMGSGAFLVQACRFLGDRLVESWAKEEAHGRVIDSSGASQASNTEREVLPPGNESRREHARRLVAERCLYGVDMNPLAVELAKLSLWLVTLSKGKPFGFLDHHLRHGDSLLGIHQLEQLTQLTMNPKSQAHHRLFGRHVAQAVAEALALKARLAELPTLDVRDVEAKAALEREARKKLDGARLVADGLVGAVLAGGDGADASLAVLAAEADRVVSGDQRAVESVRRRSQFDLAIDATVPRRPCHWPLEFPDVFVRENSGFDAIIGNPPFLNAIEHASARSASMRAYYASSFPFFAQGAYDLVLLFWARAMQHALRSLGRYGLLGPTALLSDSGPWKMWVHESWRPVSLFLYPVDFFTAARIRTTAVVGQRGRSETVLVASLDPQTGLLKPTLRAWPDDNSNWYSVVSAVPISTSAQPPPNGATKGSLVALNEIAEVFAGCTTADAYNLKPEIEDSKLYEGQRLITTGAIDRYLSKWGAMKIRYLKDDYTHPRWPTVPSDRGVKRAVDRQRRPKILVGGLTAVIEAWFDEAGDSAGIVQTWVVLSKGQTQSGPSENAEFWWLTGVLNSAYFSRVFVSRYGAQSMSGKQITVKKANLLEMPLPRPTIGDARDATRGLQSSTLEAVDEGTLGRLLVQVCRAMQRPSISMDGLAVLDKVAHLVVSSLYGRQTAEAEEDYRWWSERAGVATVDLDWEALTGPLTTILQDGS